MAKDSFRYEPLDASTINNIKVKLDQYTKDALKMGKYLPGVTRTTMTIEQARRLLETARRYHTLLGRVKTWKPGELIEIGDL